jgi:hypothetical protein
VLVVANGEIPPVEERPSTPTLPEDAVLVVVVVGLGIVVTKVLVNGGVGVTVSCIVAVGVGTVVSAGGCVSVIGVAVPGGVSPPYVQTPSVPNGICTYCGK